MAYDLLRFLNRLRVLGLRQLPNSFPAPSVPVKPCFDLCRLRNLQREPASVPQPLPQYAISRAKAPKGGFERSPWETQELSLFPNSSSRRLLACVIYLAFRQDDGRGPTLGGDPLRNKNSARFGFVDSYWKRCCIDRRNNRFVRSHSQCSMIFSASDQFASN